MGAERSEREAYLYTMRPAQHKLSLPNCVYVFFPLTLTREHGGVPLADAEAPLSLALFSV